MRLLILNKLERIYQAKRENGGDPISKYSIEQFQNCTTFSLNAFLRDSSQMMDASKML
jgi:hypothetical protein